VIDFSKGYNAVLPPTGESLPSQELSNVNSLADLDAITCGHG